VDIAKACPRISKTMLCPPLDGQTTTLDAWPKMRYHTAPVQLSKNVLPRQDRCLSTVHGRLL